MLVQLWYAHLDHRFLGTYFVCVCLVCPVSLKLTTVARYAGRMEWINLVGDLLRGELIEEEKSGDFTSWSVLHNAPILLFYSRSRILNLVRIRRSLFDGEGKFLICSSSACSTFTCPVIYSLEIQINLKTTTPLLHFRAESQPFQCFFFSLL